MADELYLARLDEIVADLGNSITDFNDASDIAKGISRSVGRPMNDDKLQDRVGDFEDEWNKTRDSLVEELDGIHKHLKDIQQGFAEWDFEAKKAFLNSRASDVPKAK
ncbi:hypothetical protein [Glutamicibacter sp.]|uniref:hypothetical protein n=1 Tax=Glutamicibacter sp. TaxID=1931995 RepID=UPI003D6A0407